MPRPKKPTALKVAEGAHISKAEAAEGISKEVFAADGKIEPPKWLTGAAKEHFERNARYMEEKNRLAGVNIYGSMDVESLAMMCVSYQKALECLDEERDARTSKERDAAQRRRLAENRNYRDFRQELQLKVADRFDAPDLAGDDDDSIKI